MNRAALLDAAERIFWTALQAFLGTLLASGIFDNLGLNWEDALKIAGVSALASAAKTLLAIAITHNSTPQLGVNTYDNNPDPTIDSPTGIGRNG